MIKIIKARRHWKRVMPHGLIEMESLVGNPKDESE